MATVWVSAIKKKLILIKSKNGHYVTLLCFNFGFVDNAGGCLVFLLVIIYYYDSSKEPYDLEPFTRPTEPVLSLG